MDKLRNAGPVFAAGQLRILPADSTAWVLTDPDVALMEALNTSRSADADAAVVDLVLHGHLAYPIAEVLAKRGTPFGCATGRDTAATESAWEQRPCLGKPFSADEVRQFIIGLLPPT